MAAVNDGRMFDTPFNVVAAFRTRQEAERAARRLASAGMAAGGVELGPRPDPGGPVETAELRADMQDELNADWFPATGRQAQGALVGTAAFAAAGIVVGGVIGLIAGLGLGPGMSLAGTILVGVAVGLAAGATAGFVAGGGFAPRCADDPALDFDDPRPLAERDVLLAVHTAEPETAERAARLLGDLHADGVHLVDATGTPLPPQHANPRPADPEGYWWKRAGKG